MRPSPIIMQMLQAKQMQGMRRWEGELAVLRLDVCQDLRQKLSANSIDRGTLLLKRPSLNKTADDDHERVL